MGHALAAPEELPCRLKLLVPQLRQPPPMLKHGRLPLYRHSICRRRPPRTFLIGCGHLRYQTAVRENREDRPRLIMQLLPENGNGQNHFCQYHVTYGMGFDSSALGPNTRQSQNDGWAGSSFFANLTLLHSTSHQVEEGPLTFARNGLDEVGGFDKYFGCLQGRVECTIYSMLFSEKAPRHMKRLRLSKSTDIRQTPNLGLSMVHSTLKAFSSATRNPPLIQREREREREREIDK
ncbi:hypothetical protein LZ30DRAFT_461544 [Colletotrichum cereale]|nr:hypothetical protein LZ30DRAFT_461544 [Colletotrichum cereale]